MERASFGLRSILPKDTGIMDKGYHQTTVKTLSIDIDIV
jgi:hypothetical protein